MNNIINKKGWGSNKQDYLNNKESAFGYLNRQSALGHILSINCFDALTKYLDSNQVLSTIMNVSQNKQNIPHYLLDKLALYFDP